MLTYSTLLVPGSGQCMSDGPLEVTIKVPRPVEAASSLSPTCRWVGQTGSDTAGVTTQANLL